MARADLGMPRVAVCYDGGGWTIPYLIGITKALQDDARTRLDPPAFAGVSSGACVALAAALDVPMEDLLGECLEWARTCRAFPHMSVTAVRAICKRRLAVHSDAETSRRLEGRFAVGVSRHTGLSLVLEPHVVSSFATAAEVAAVVAASCTVPGVNTLPDLIPPDERRLGYVDGVLTMRFFAWPAAEQHFEVRVSAATDRKGATIACPVRLPLLSGVYPMPERDLIDLYGLGLADGPKLVEVVHDRRYEKDRGTLIGHHRQQRPQHDRSTVVYERLHVGGRRDIRVPQASPHAARAPPRARPGARTATTRQILRNPFKM
jgi:predicted acylesterase/phospholipase RssA